MSDRKEILNELLTISPTLAAAPIEPVFAVPAGYFDDFPSKMVEMIKKQEKSGVTAELESISPFLASLEKKNPFTVPEGYFASLEKGLESTRISEKQPDGEKTIPGQPARVVQFGYSRRMGVMFAAASVLALVGFFTWFFVMNNNTVSGPATAININSELPKVSATEMANYLESIPDDPDIEPISLAGVEEADLDEIMNGINEAELQQFINENPGLLEENMN